MSIEIKPSHKGRLHAALGVPQGEKIPPEKIEQAKHSSSPALRKQANFASNAAKWKRDYALDTTGICAYLLGSDSHNLTSYLKDSASYSWLPAWPWIAWMVLVLALAWLVVRSRNWTTDMLCLWSNWMAILSILISAASAWMYWNDLRIERQQNRQQPQATPRKSTSLFLRSGWRVSPHQAVPDGGVLSFQYQLVSHLPAACLMPCVPLYDAQPESDGEPTLLQAAPWTLRHIQFLEQLDYVKPRTDRLVQEWRLPLHTPSIQPFAFFVVPVPQPIRLESCF